MNRYQSLPPSSNTKPQTIYFSQSLLDLTISKVCPTQWSSQQMRLPLISPPLISTYRSVRLIQNHQQSQSFFDKNFIFDIFCGKSSEESISMCANCQKHQHLSLCQFMVNILESTYDWRWDKKFVTTYQSYNKKKINIPITDDMIAHRLQSKFNILGIGLIQNHKLLLTRILKNYIKHTITYKTQQCLSYQTDIYFWFLIGIYYHVGIPKYYNQMETLPIRSVSIHQPMMFWILDMIMNRIGIFNQAKIKHYTETLFQFCHQFYPKQCYTIINQYNVPLKEIFYQWVGELMMGYMGIQFIGFFINSILKQGFDYALKSIMSYFQKRTQRLQKDQIVFFYDAQSSKINQNGQSIQQINKKKQQIMKVLIDSHEQWPAIFFNTTTFQI